MPSSETPADRATGLSRALPRVSLSRVVGVDVARCLALLGMMATHVLPGFDGARVPWPQQLAGGRASALFAVLAGVSLALVSGRERPPHGRVRVAASVRILVRALLIGALGLTLGLLPTHIAVILGYYAVLFLLGLPFLGWSSRVLAVAAAAWVVVLPVVSMVVRPHLPPRVGGSPTPGDLLDPGRLAADLLFTGYYPAAVWVAYLLAGLAVGRSSLRRPRTAATMAGLGAALVVGAALLSRALLARPGAQDALRADFPYDVTDPAMQDAFLVHGFSGSTPTGTWWWLAVDTPHSGTPLDLARTIGSALLVIGVCLLVTRAGTRLWAAAFGAGAMTLSLYTLHVLVMAEGYWPHLERDYTEQVILVLGTGAVFALLGLRGPLEWLVGETARAAGAIAGPPSRRPAPSGRPADE